MQTNLVIVESPAKAKTIEKFLGKDFKVLSSYGHIRDLKKKSFSVDVENHFKPIYEIPADKRKLVQQLKEEAEKASTIWLASDEDREGEAIAWHLYEVLGLTPANTKRIVFHEITKNAILKAIEKPRDIDINLVDAQQARRILDRIVGFELSPVLWKKVKPALSAGRVQSVTVRLIVEREREIQNFQTEESYKVTAIFFPKGKEQINKTFKAELNRRFATKEEAVSFLEKCKNEDFIIKDIETHPLQKSPSAPFTTSTLQQEAARKLGFTVAQTMTVAQKLYESGKITYMRTDSVHLSELAIASCRKAITETMGKEYFKQRQFTTKSKGAQEAHEAIRPTHIEDSKIEGTGAEKKLYDLIWKRTIASQMANALVEKTTITIVSENNDDEYFVTTGETIKFDGFLKVYKESNDDDESTENESVSLPVINKGDRVSYQNITAVQRFTQHPPRYTEAGLVRKLEELGIGRPSTYAPTISTIQQRDYVIKESKEGYKRNFSVITLDNKNIKEENKSEITGTEKNKLFPTDIGIVVNDFLIEYFPNILDYNFTANVEEQFDNIAEGNKEWSSVLDAFYKKFHPEVEKTLTTKQEHKAGERILGNEPKTGKTVSVKIGRFGPVVQIGAANEDEKPRFSQLKKGMSIETITLEEALDLFKLPRELGEHDGMPITIGTGRFGPYIYFQKKYTTLPKEYDPMTVTLEEAIELIREKEESERKKHIKQFAEHPELEIMNGKYGPYISFEGSNYKIPKGITPEDLSFDSCMELIRIQKEKGASTAKRKKAAK